MGIARSHEAEAVRAGESLGLESQSSSQGLADIASLGLTEQHPADPIGRDFKPGPFIVVRQRRVGLRCAFDLGDLHQGFVSHALLGVRAVHGVARPIHQLEHLTVRAVGVVGNRQTFDALFPQPVHPIPQPFRVLGMKARKRFSRKSIAITKDYIAMEIAPIVGRGCVLVRDKGRKVPGAIELLGRFDDILPRGSRDFRRDTRVEVAVHDGTQKTRNERRKGLKARDQRKQALVVWGVQVVQGLGKLKLRDFGRCVRCLSSHAQEKCMIRYRVEVQGFSKCHVEPARVKDRLAQGIAISLPGPHRCPEHKGVKGIRRVNV